MVNYCSGIFTEIINGSVFALSFVNLLQTLLPYYLTILILIGYSLLYSRFYDFERLVTLETDCFYVTNTTSGLPIL